MQEQILKLLTIEEYKHLDIIGRQIYWAYRKKCKEQDKENYDLQRGIKRGIRRKNVTSEQREEYKRQWRLENKELLREKSKQYYLKNKVKINEEAKKFRLENIDEVRRIEKEYYLRNRERIKQKNKEWYHKTKQKSGQQ